MGWISFVPGLIAVSRSVPEMTRWTPQRVLDAAAAWAWVPDDAIDVTGGGYRLVRYPDRLLDPSFPAAQVLWSRTARPLTPQR
jgi:hypothetical protein